MKKNLKKDYKNVKITQRSPAYEGYASAYNAEILNSFNLELQLKNIKYPIKKK